MGIRNMNKLIRTTAPKCMREFYLSELKDKRLVVDALIFIYDVKKRMKVTRSTFRFIFLQKLVPFLEQTNHITFVFDGKKVKEKTHTVMKRRLEKQKLKLKMKNTQDPQVCSHLDRQLVEVYPSDIYDAKDIIKQRGLIIVQSCDEGEATCARLVKEDHADFILTSDTDCLAFGQSYIHRKCRKIDEQPPSTTSYLFTDLPRLRKELGFESQNQFVDCCVLLGCDFSDPLKKLVHHKIPGVLREHKSIENYLKFATEVNLPHFTTDRNCPKTLLRSKDLFINCLGSYTISMPLNHRQYHLQILLNEAVQDVESPKDNSKVITASNVVFLPKKQGGNNACEERGIFQEPHSSENLFLIPKNNLLNC
jgi:5'-3' exonuclease